MQFSCGTLLFSRMKFNRSAAFLIFNAHFEQTQRKIRFRIYTKFKSSRVIISPRKRFPAVDYRNLKRFSHERLSSIQFKVDLAHTAKIWCILGFRLSTAFSHWFRWRVFVHSKRSLYSMKGMKIPENLPEQYFFARVKLSHVQRRNCYLQAVMF